MSIDPETKKIFDEYKVCVLLPTYNNNGTIAGVIDGIRLLTNDLIVVNDGSSDDTAKILDQYPDIHLISYTKNKGKGNALLTGFRYAISKGYHYAITIDSDGQHNPADIPAFAEKLQETGQALIIGERNMEQASVPGKSNFGRKFSNFWFKVETGITHNDTQSGFRLYPLLAFENMKFYTPKFEFEIEILVRLAWKGIKVESVPVSVRYFPKEERVSHFRPFRDFTRISILNTALVFLALAWHRPLIYIKGKNVSGFFFNSSETVLKRSLSVAFGVFMGIIPIWGFQMVAAIALAFLFRLNKPLVILFANISIPPMIPLILFLSLVCGKFWVSNATIPLFNSALNLETIKPFLLQYIVGSISLAILSAIVFGTLTFIVLSTFKRVKA
jgi:glycosyltransferase involved in cell wall biosynthesis